MIFFYFDAGVQEDQVLQQVYGNVELKIALNFTFLFIAFF